MREQVIRRNQETGLTTLLYLDEVFDVLCKKFSAAQFDSRLEIVAALCAGETLETNDGFEYRLEAK